MMGIQLRMGISIQMLARDITMYTQKGHLMVLLEQNIEKVTDIKLSIV